MDSKIGLLLGLLLVALVTVFTYKPEFNNLQKILTKRPNLALDYQAYQEIKP